MNRKRNEEKCLICFKSLPSKPYREVEDWDEREFFCSDCYNPYTFSNDFNSKRNGVDFCCEHQKNALASCKICDEKIIKDEREKNNESLRIATEERQPTLGFKIIVLGSDSEGYCGPSGEFCSGRNSLCLHTIPRYAEILVEELGGRGKVYQSWLSRGGKRHLDLVREHKATETCIKCSRKWTITVNRRQLERALEKKKKNGGFICKECERLENNSSNRYYSCSHQKEATSPCQQCANQGNSNREI